MTDPLAYSVNDAARAIGVGKTKLYELINERRLRSFKIGSRTLVSHVDLAEFIQEVADGV